jgi:uncharacterized protein (TIGR03437 family)
MLSYSMMPPPLGWVSILAVSLACQLSAADGIINTVAGSGPPGLIGQYFSGDGGPATLAQMNGPSDVVVDALGNLFISDGGNFRIRKVSRDGVIVTIAGNGVNGFSGDNGPATLAAIGQPGPLALDATGNLFFVDYGSLRIRRVSTDGTITTVAGNGNDGFSGDGGPAIGASLVPVGIAIDPQGNLLISGYGRVRMVTKQGTITTVAGTGADSSSGDGGPASAASFLGPGKIAIDQSGSIYVIDGTTFQGKNYLGVQRVRRFAVGGTINTYAGNSTGGFSGDGGPALSAGISPVGLALDSAGNLFIGDAYWRVRRVDTAGIISTIAGTGVNGFSGDGGLALSAKLETPTSVWVDGSGDIFVADSGNDRVREIVYQSAPPAINSGGVVPVYSSTPMIQPGEWASIFGTSLAGSAATWKGDFPTTLNGTSVRVNGKLAYLWFVSSTQINFQAPDDTTTGPVPVSVTTLAGTVSTTVTLAPSAPSFCRLDDTHIAGIILTPNLTGDYAGFTYNIVGPAGNSLGYPTVPAKAGDSLVLFAVGLGPTAPLVPSGMLFSGAAPVTGPISLSINGVPITSTFVGETSAGLYQINVTLPSGLGTGDVPIQVAVGGAPSPKTAVISLQ